MQDRHVPMAAAPSLSMVAMCNEAEPIEGGSKYQSSGLINHSVMLGIAFNVTR